MIRMICDRCEKDCTDDSEVSFLELCEVGENYTPEGTLRNLGLLCGTCIASMMKWLESKGNSE